MNLVVVIVFLNWLLLIVFIENEHLIASGTTVQQKPEFLMEENSNDVDKTADTSSITLPLQTNTVDDDFNEDDWNDI